MFAKALAPIDRLLNRVTMYRLVMYYLGGLLAIAVLESWRGELNSPVIALLGTVVVLVLACLAVNNLFASVFGAPCNDDSAIITGLILALIVGPARTRDDYAFLALVAALAMASKYVLAWHRAHLFNPAAVAIVLTGLVGGQTASWWVGTAHLTPFVIAGGLLLMRKLRRGDLVASFFWATLFTTFAWTAWDGVPFLHELNRALPDSPIWFLGFVMLTEPVTVPPSKARQLLYGVLAGVLVAPQLHVAGYYLTPELGLVLANAFTIPLRSRQKRVLRLDRAVTIGPGLMDFLYAPLPPLAFRPGQYMEWTLDHPHPDGRGKRRYFTLASSPTERTLRIGIKFMDAGSSFKQAMTTHTQRGDTILVSQVAGDFTLPRNSTQKLAFIAGGIGITPFRSMVKYLTDRRENRDVVLLYANRHYDEIVYQDVFAAAQRVFRFRPVFVLSDPASAPWWWQGEQGHIDAQLIERQIPDYRERLFYVSGSVTLVQSVREALRELGVKPSQIKTDDFAGLAA